MPAVECASISARWLREMVEAEPGASGGFELGVFEQNTFSQ